MNFFVFFWGFFERKELILEKVNISNWPGSYQNPRTGWVQRGLVKRSLFDLRKKD
jgi:hypothetical protein